jgi:hypothetical protein
MNYLKCFIVFTLLTLPVLSGCSSEPKWVGVYEECKEKVSEGFTDMKDSSNTEVFGNMLQSVGMAACEVIKSSCEHDPDGATCKSIINSKNEK